MRPLTFITLSLVLLVSCQKEIRTLHHSRYIENVKSALKDSLSQADYITLDFSKAILSKVDSASLYMFRVPLKGKNIKNDFVILKTDANGIVERGKIIHLEGNEVEYGDQKIKERKWNGTVSISSLNRNSVLNSSIDNGYIVALHAQGNSRTASEPIYPDPYIELPEVIVVAYIQPSGGISYSDWVWLESLFYDAGGMSTGGYYGSADGGGGGGTGGSYGGDTYYGSDGSSGGIYASVDDYDLPLDPPILVDYEGQYADPAIDLDKYVKCFTNIPDAGATCSIEILTDIPVDNDPSKFFDWSNGSPGHTFLQIKKSNGSQFAMQNIGFYPVSGWKTTLTTAPIDGKFVDNSGHEYNASLKMNITPDQLNSALIHMQYLARFIKYDIDEYNCTDWAMDIFNHVRDPLKALTIQKYDLPGAAAPYGTSTPNGLYLKLQEMKNSGGPDASNVDIGFLKGYVATSNGPCN
jgi:hypothetical protein